jgi:hypothetical protein
MNQEDFTDASDDDVSDDDMEEFFTEENIGYAMKILEVSVLVTYSCEHFFV